MILTIAGFMALLEDFEDLVQVIELCEEPIIPHDELNNEFGYVG